MRVTALTAILGGLALTAALATDVAAADAKKGGLCHVVCSDTPAPPPPRRPAPPPPRHVAVRHIVRHRAHHYAHDSYYSYREAERVDTDFRDNWREAPNDAMIPGPGYYQQSYAQAGNCDCGAGLQVDRYGWTGGVGYMAGGGGEFVDGYGMVHFADGSSLNGPTYNSYGQSFQFNPSIAGPFQPRVMGGVAIGPHHVGGFVGGPHVMGGFGFRR